MRPRPLLLTLGLAACLAASIGSASADPAPAPAPKLPAGWVRGGDQPEPLPPPPKIEWGTHQGNHVFSFSTRSSIRAASLDLAALPTMELTPSAIPAEPPAALPPGSPGDVIVLKKGAAPRVSIAAFEAGVIQIGKARPQATGRQSEGGVPGACGAPSAGAGLRPLRYDAIRRADKQGNIELVWARGYIDAATCAISILERRSARPQHVAGGVVYAFRTRCPACAEAERDVLHVLTPQLGGNVFDLGWVPFQHRTLPLLPGRSAAFDGSSSFTSPSGAGATWSLPDWQGVVDRKCKEDSTWCAKRVRLEVSWAAGEPAPTAFLGGDLGP